MDAPPPLPRIDLVYTYVDGADPAHRARREATRLRLAAVGPVPREKAIWYHGVGEIGFSIRSALSAMPWIGTIHVVSDAQVPPVDRDLIDSGRVRLVDHRDIIPEIYRPTFASTIIESFLHRIPGLAEIWLYNNDDFFNSGAIGPETFLEPADTNDVRLILRTVPAAVRIAIRQAADWSPAFVPRANAYTSGIANAAMLLRRRFGLRWSKLVFPRHVTQVYRSETARRLEDLFPAELHEARMRHFRSPSQLSWSTLAYSAESHWFGALARRHRPFSPLAQSDEHFVDFARLRPGATTQAAWQRVQGTKARFICLNNIPQAEVTAFAETMAQRGLGPRQP